MTGFDLDIRYIALGQHRQTLTDYIPECRHKTQLQYPDYFEYHDTLISYLQNQRRFYHQLHD